MVSSKFLPRSVLRAVCVLGLLAGSLLWSDMSMTAGATEPKEGWTDIRENVQSAGCPLLTTPAWMAEGNQAGCFFGSVSNAGDVNGDGYDDVIVGAYSYDHPETDEGAVFLYYGGPEGLSAEPAWMVESNQASCNFGYDLAFAGDVNGDGYDDIIIGAWWYDNPERNEGAAFLYYGGPAGPALTPDWMADCNQADACFGRMASTAGDVNGDGYGDVIITAVFYTHPEFYEGAAFLYYGSASGLPASPDRIVEPNWTRAMLMNATSAGDVNGDGYGDVIIGMVQYANPEFREGAAWVFLGGPSGLAETPVWKVESNVTMSYYGWVCGPGDVNGDGYDDVTVWGWAETDEWRGRVHCYHGGPTGPSPTYAWMQRGEQAYCRLQAFRTRAGDVNGDGYADVIFPAVLYDNPEPDEGRVYVHCGGPEGLSETAAWTVESNQPNAQYGNFFATGAGDVNGDGYDDVIIGAVRYDNPETDEGAAFVYYGCGSGCTEAGGEVVANPIDPETGTAPVTMTFENIVEPGITYLEIETSGPPAPSLFKVCSNTYYQLTTTAVYEGAVEICIDYSGTACEGKKNLKLSRFEDGDWVDYTTSHDPATNTICCEVTSLSSFTVLVPVDITFDIKPRSCPNPFNITWLENVDEGNGNDHAMSKKGGVLPAALVGSGDFDVNDVDVSTLRLEGIEPLRTSYEDVSRPVTVEDECACTTGGPDGILDLTMKFSRMDLAGLLESAEHGDVVRLVLTGELLDGTPFEADDCINILSKRPEPVMEEVEEGEEVKLGPAVPNPFNPSTMISYYLPGERSVTLEIFDSSGRSVARILDGERTPAGWHAVEWRGIDRNGRAVASGLYFYRLRTEDVTISKKMILIR